VARRVIAVLAVAFVAAGCGAASRHSTTGVARQRYTLQQVKAAFAAEGIPLDKMLRTRRRHEQATVLGPGYVGLVNDRLNVA
jgi:hypothetical protein